MVNKEEIEELAAFEVEHTGDEDIDFSN